MYLHIIPADYNLSNIVKRSDVKESTCSSPKDNEGVGHESMSLE